MFGLVGFLFRLDSGGDLVDLLFCFASVRLREDIFWIGFVFFVGPTPHGVFLLAWYLVMIGLRA